MTWVMLMSVSDIKENVFKNVHILVPLQGLWVLGLDRVSSYDFFERSPGNSNEIYVYILV